MPVTSKNNTGVDLSGLGFTEVAPEKDSHVDLSELGFTEVKKKNGLSVGSNWQLKQSTPTTSVSVESNAPIPDFGMASHADLAKGQMNAVDNQTPTAVTQFQESVEEKAHREERAAKREADKQRKITATPIAIEDAAKKSLKIKGLDPNNKALLNKEKSKFALEIASGNADVGFDKEGKAGLVTTPGFFESFHDNMMEAINNTKNARDFKDMTVPQRVEFAKKLQQKDPSAYIGVKPTPAGSIGAMTGGAAPTIGLYGAGALTGSLLESAAPATGGLSNLALKPVMSFVMNAGSGANQKGMEGTLSRFNSIKQMHPDMSDEEAMTQAGKGEDVDRLAGIAESALFSKTGNELKMGKSATGNLLKGMAKSGLDVGGKVAAVEGLKDVGHNVEGVTNKSAGDIVKDMGEAFKENAPVGLALHGFMAVLSGAAKVPGMLKSALKYDVVTKMPPEEIHAALNENVKSGAIPPEVAEKAANDLVEFGQTLKKIPDGLSEESKASVAGLILKRDNLKKEAEGKDESANDIHNQEIESINNQIKEIYRTDKPLEHEINPTTGETFKKPTFDNIAAMRVKNLADKISKGKEITDPEELQTEHTFPEEVEKHLNRIVREEKSANRDKENPNTDLTDNVEKYLNDKTKQSEKTKVEIPVSAEKTGVRDESVNPVEQPTAKIEITERTPEEIKTISREPLPIEKIDTKVEIPDYYEKGKKVKAFEARTEYRNMLKHIDNIIKCL